MGELHLDILVDRMRREFKVEANVGKPQVAYRETIRKVDRSTTPTRSRPVAGPVREGPDLPRAVHRRGRRDLRVREQGHRWPHPREYIPSVDAGAQDAMQYGVLAATRW